MPCQNNTNYNYGPESENQNVLNIQPVIPVTLSSDWTLVTRTIMPLISQPAFVPADNTSFGLGDIQFSAFLSPSDSKSWTRGVGAAAQAST